MSAHRCHAEGCELGVPPSMLMCRRHWFSLPSDLRRQVWAAYREGQERDKRPTRRWCEAADAAVAHVAQREGRSVRHTFTESFFPAAAAESAR